MFIVKEMGNAEGTYPCEEQLIAFVTVSIVVLECWALLCEGVGGCDGIWAVSCARLTWICRCACVWITIGWVCHPLHTFYECHCQQKYCELSTMLHYHWFYYLIEYKSIQNDHQYCTINDSYKIMFIYPSFSSSFSFLLSLWMGSLPSPSPSLNQPNPQATISTGSSDFSLFCPHLNSPSPSPKIPSLPAPPAMIISPPSPQLPAIYPRKSFSSVFPQ